MIVWKPDKQSLQEAGFDRDQIAEIMDGVNAGLDVSVYAKKDFFAIQMRQIKLGMLENLSVDEYTDPAYDWFQMEEIRKGLSKKVDISLYAFPNIPYDKMREIRKGLEAGINLSGYLQLSAGVLKELREALLASVDIVEYIGEGYEAEQLVQIRQAMLKDLDIRPYLTQEFRGISIREICDGLEKGLDVSVYAKIEYSWQQMRELRLGMESGLDVSVYQSKYYSWQQMKEIRLGLEAGVDVSGYSSLMYTANDMKQKRLKLMQSVESEPEEAIHNETQTNDFVIMISPDGMTAHITVKGAARKIRRDDILKALMKSNVTHGILNEEVDRIAKGNFGKRPILIAKGTPPKDGKDGWYEYFFRTEVDRSPAVLEDGSVDFQNMDWFEVVKRGQKLVVYHSADSGVPGTTVRGRTLQARKGKEMRALTGSGFQVLPDQKTYVADIDGIITLRGNRLEISRILMLEEVTLATGNVNFDGSVYIKGNVGDGTVVRATEDVVVDGFVESAEITSGGNIVLRQGANASGRSSIRAEGNIIGKFFETTTVYAKGDIQANYCLNCDLYAEGKLIISGKSGSLVGGRTTVISGLQAYNLGNRTGVKTRIWLGATDEVRERLVLPEAEIKDVQRELKVLQNTCEDMRRKYPPEVRNTMDSYLKMENAVYAKEKQLAKLIAQSQQMEDTLLNMNDAEAVVKGTIYEGVLIEMNGQKLKCEKTRSATVRWSEDRIGIFPSR